MATVKETNEVFATQKLQIKLPYPEDWEVKSMEILEKKDFPGAIHVLLGLKMIDRQGKEVSDLFYAQSDYEREPTYKTSLKVIKNDMLPLRETVLFKDEAEAVDYLHYAIKSLLEDKGYAFQDNDTDLYGKKEERGFYININARSDEKSLEKVDQLIKLREKYGDVFDYGLVIPAFQESLGITRMDQEAWMSSNIDFFSNNHVGIFAVDNKDPNSIYPFTVYPKEKELRKYFIKTSSKWTLIRSRYVSYRPGVEL